VLDSFKKQFSCIITTLQGKCHYYLPFYFEDGGLCFAQAGLELMDPSDPPTLASQVAGKLREPHHARLLSPFKKEEIKSGVVVCTCKS
jgi:hypothetical protein